MGYPSWSFVVHLKYKAPLEVMCYLFSQAAKWFQVGILPGLDWNEAGKSEIVHLSKGNQQHIFLILDIC